MALQMSYTTGDGVVHAESYWVANTVARDHLGNEALVTAMCFNNKAARDAGKISCANMVFDVKGDDFNTYFSTTAMNPEGKNIVSLAYAYLKTLPMFKDAIDV